MNTGFWKGTFFGALGVIALFGATIPETLTWYSPIVLWAFGSAVGLLSASITERKQ